jgi:hypothetical protein
MVDFNIKDGIDTLSSVNNVIPTGALVMKASSPSLLTQYDTDEECLAAGFMPCDGRELFTYDKRYADLYATIDNIYGGTTSVPGITDNSNTYSRVATFQSVVFQSTYSILRFSFDNLDSLFNYSNYSVQPFGGFINTITETFVDVYYPFIINFAGPITFTVNKNFKIPNLRTSRRYIYGRANASDGIYTPLFSGNTTNAVTHSHSFSGNFNGNLSTNGTAGSHHHSTSYTFSDGGSDYHSHLYEASAGGLNTSGALGTTLTKSDGTGTAAGAAHTHSTGGVYLYFNTGNSGGSHSHSGSGFSDSHTEPTHTHTFTSSNISIPVSSSIDIPYINMLYFIKL